MTDCKTLITGSTPVAASKKTPANRQLLCLLTLLVDPQCRHFADETPGTALARRSTAEHDRDGVRILAECNPAEKRGLPAAEIRHLGCHGLHSGRLTCLSSPLIRRPEDRPHPPNGPPPDGLFAAAIPPVSAASRRSFGALPPASPWPPLRPAHMSELTPHSASRGPATPPPNGPPPDGLFAAAIPPVCAVSGRSFGALPSVSARPRLESALSSGA